MEALSVINLLPSNEDQIKNFASLIVKEVKCGNVNPLDLKIQIQNIERALSIIKADTRENLLNEVDKHGKSFTYKGYKIDQCELGTRYDYSSDSIHAELTAQIKGREKFLKNLRTPIDVVDTETGEIRKFYPPIKISTTSVKLTPL